MKKILVIFLALITFSLNAQNSNAETLKISFSGFNGNTTKFVSVVRDLIINKDYEEIKGFLFSESSSKHFLGAVVCEKLEALNLISLSEEYKMRIKEIYQSDEIVYFRMGCKGSISTLKELLNSEEEEHLLSVQADEWIEKVLNNEKHND